MQIKWNQLYADKLQSKVESLMFLKITGCKTNPFETIYYLETYMIRNFMIFALKFVNWNKTSILLVSKTWS